MNKELEKTLRNAYEIKNDPYRVRIYVKNNVPYFCAADIAKAGGIKAPTKWVRSIIARNPHFQYVRILYPVMSLGGVRRFNMVFVTAEDGIRMANNLPVLFDTKRWLTEKVFSFQPDPNRKYYNDPTDKVQDLRDESDYERQIDAIIMELLEMKRKIRTERRTT